MPGRKLLRRAESMSLPLDLIMEVIMRLPAKDAFRCKFISKTLFYMISDPVFIKKHLNHLQGLDSTERVVAVTSSNGTKKIIYMRSDAAEVEFAYVPPFLVDLILVGSCNGLLCALGRPLSEQGITVVLWNPATRENMRIAYPKFTGYQSLVFGYNEGSQDYVLVKICTSDSKNTGAPVEIWTTSTNSWTELGTKLSKELEIDLVGLFAHGKFYWLAQAKGGIGRTFLDVVVSFELSNKTFRQVPLPPIAAATGHLRRIIDFKDSLALAIAVPSRIDNGTTFDLWVMGEEGEVWNKVFSIGPFLTNVVPSMASINSKILMEDRTSVPFKYFFHDPSADDPPSHLLCPESSPYLLPFRSLESLVGIQQVAAHE